MTSVTLNWSDNSDNEDGFEIFRGTSSGSLSSIATVGAGTTSYTDSGASEATTYYYRVESYTEHTSSTTTEKSITTLPTAPSGTSLDTTIEDEITVSWTDNSSGESGYRIYRSTDGTNFSQVADIAANSTSYTDTGLSDGEKYWYYVVAYNGAGESAGSTVNGITPLPTPSGVSASVIANDQIDVDWTDEINNGEYHIQISRDGASYVDPSGGSTTVGHNTTSASYGPNSDNSYDSQVGIDSSFVFRVRSETSHATSSWVSTGTVYTDPIPPHNPSVSRPHGNSFEISWTQTSDNIDYTLLEMREDTGTGYGNWTLISNNMNETKGTTSTISIDTSTDLTYWSEQLKEDARYQFRLYNKSRSNPDGERESSKYVYADYGNDSNVYFKDDFESGDVSNWDSTYGGHTINSSSGHGHTGISGSDSGTYYLGGNGASSTEATWVQKNLGDLSNESDVLVKCAFAIGSLDSSTENFNIEWYDGSAWQELVKWEHEYNEQGWFEVSEVVPDSWLSTDARIRVGDTTSSGMYGGDYFAVDRVVVSDILHEYTQPAAPSNLELDPTTTGEITATWTVNQTNFPESHQEYRDRISGSGNNLDKTSVSISKNSKTVIGYTEGETYDIRIDSLITQYRNGSIDMWPRNISTLKSITTRLPLPTNFSVDTINTNNADFSWTDNASDENGYQVRASTDESGFDMSGGSISIDDTPASEYFDDGQGTIFVKLRIDAINNTNSWSDLIEFPGGMRLERRGDSNKELRWHENDKLGNAGNYSVGETFTTTLTVDDADSKYRVYFNGSLVDTITKDEAVDASDGTITVRDPSFCEWTIMELAVYGRTLASSEIDANYNGNLPTDGLRGYWPLDENNSGTTPDMSGYGNDGTVNGATLVGDAYDDTTSVSANSTTATLSSLLEATDYNAKLRIEGNDVNGEVR